eukprot:4887066-Amphidinium_carterae.1
MSRSLLQLSAASCRAKPFWPTAARTMSRSLLKLSATRPRAIPFSVTDSKARKRWNSWISLGDGLPPLHHICDE